MSYTFRGNFQFELAKASISQQRNPAPPGRPSLSETLNYACQLPPQRGFAGFRSKQGLPLRIESSPFCSQQPEQISLLALRGKARRTGVKFKPAAPADTATARKAVKAAAAPPAAPDEEEPLPSKRQKLAPALLSVTLAVLVAATVGMVIGHNNAFRIKSPQISHLDQRDTTVAAVQPAPPVPAPAGSPASTEAVALTPSLEPKLQEAITAPLPEPKLAEKPRHVKHARKKHVKPHPAPPPAPPADRPFYDDGPEISVQAEPAKKAPVHHSLRAELAKCERFSLIARERCKWRICNHKWGKNGCPAFAQPANQTIMGIAYAASRSQGAASSPHS